MATIFQKCFVCAKDIMDTELTESTVQSESSFIFTHVLNLPHLDLDWHTFQHQVSYCSICLDKISKIRLVLEQLEELENEVIRQKYDIELKLKENVLEFHRNNSAGQNQSSLAPVLDLRNQIVTELKSRTIISMLAKIRKKHGNCAEIRPPHPRPLQVMKDVSIPRLSNVEIVTNEKSRPPNCSTAQNNVNFAQPSQTFSEIHQVQPQNQSQMFRYNGLRDLLTGKRRISETNLDGPVRHSSRIKDLNQTTGNTVLIPVAVPPKRRDRTPASIPRKVRRNSSTDSILDIISSDNIPSTSPLYFDQRVIPIPHFLQPSYNFSAHEVNPITSNVKNAQPGQGQLLTIKSEIITPEVQVQQTNEEEMSFICGICGEILHDYDLLVEHDKLHVNRQKERLPPPTPAPSPVPVPSPTPNSNSNPNINSANNTRIINKNLNRTSSKSTTSTPQLSSSFDIPSSGDCPINCVECGKTLANAQELGEHIVREHAYGSLISTSTECTTVFSTGRHDYNKITHKKYFECKFCPKKFTVKCFLEQHLASHNRTLAPLACHLCPGKPFKSRDHLALHKMDHMTSKRRP